ncbi:MAG: hypothetical protein WDZ35_05080 [Crocinitomicaceae bacterium]
MGRWKRVLTIALIVLGPGMVIYFLATHLKNKFIELPYLGQWTYTTDSTGKITDSTAFTIPDFSLTRLDGKIINRDSIRGKFIVLSTLQPDCPNFESCGMGMYHFNEIFFRKLVKNQDNYANVKVLTVLTDLEGNPLPDSASSQIKEEMEAYDSDIWWTTFGDPTPLFSWEYYGENFMTYESDPKLGEVGRYAFINSLVLIDDKGHIRGVSGAKKDSDIRNFFDLLKLLKKEEFDRKWEEEHPED